MLALTQVGILLYINPIFYANSWRRIVLGGLRIEDRGSRIEDCLMRNDTIFDPRSVDGPCRIRTYNQRIMLTTTAFAALRLTRVGLCGLDYLFTLRVYRLVSTPSSLWARLGSGLPYCFRNPGFPEFDRFYKCALKRPGEIPARSVTRLQPTFENLMAIFPLRLSMLESAALTIELRGHYKDQDAPVSGAAHIRGHIPDRQELHSGCLLIGFLFLCRCALVRRRFQQRRHSAMLGASPSRRNETLVGRSLSRSSPAQDTLLDFGLQLELLRRYGVARRHR